MQDCLQNLAGMHGTMDVINVPNRLPFFPIYKNLEEGEVYTGKSLPVAAKNYKEIKPKEVVVYVGQYFGIFPFLEFLKIYAECALEV